MTAVLAVGGAALAVDAHWQPVIDPNDTIELWSSDENWSTGIAPNGTDQTIWMATANSAECVVESGGAWVINQLKLGEGGDGSNYGHLIVKGTITTGNNWQGIGAWGTQIGILEVDGGQFNTTGGGHLWIGQESDGTVIIRNGGQVNVGVGGGAQIGHGWSGGFGRSFIYDGLLTVNNWTTGSINPGTGSFIDIERGTLSIAGYRFSPNDGSGTAVNLCAQDGRIRGFSNASFDKKINIDNAGNNNENDVINNVVLSWDGSRTIVTAIHPQQPAPYFNDVLVTGDIEFGWNNWDPNQPGDSVFAELWIGTDPNKLGDDYELVTTLDVTGAERSTFVKNLAPGFYYWQVDTTNGPGSFHEGDLFWFEVVSYKAPILTGGRSVVTTLDLLPANLSASVATFGTPLSSVDFTLLDDDMEFPAGANAVLSNTTVDLQNPTAQLTTNMAGTYTILLTVYDGTTTLEKLIEVDVYADACQAKKDSPSGWTANYYDRNGDCFVTIHDFAIFAEAWLTDTTMKAQETESRDVDYFPRSIFDARIEGESVDPDAVSDAPVTDESGIRIVNEGGATGGGQALGWTGTGAYAEYELTIPAAGTYDVYLSTAAPNGNAVLSFGDGITADLYGSAGSIPGLGWGNYSISKHEGALFFPAAGAYTVRITWTNEANLDWFSLVQQ
jgi:hypothetical protein